MTASLKQTINDPQTTIPVKPNHNAGVVLTRPSAEKAAWGPVAGIVYGMLGAFIGGSIAASIIVTVAMLLVGFDIVAIDNWQKTITGVLLVSLLTTVFVAVAILFYVKHRGGTLKQLGLTTVRWRHVGYAVVGVISYLLLYVVVVSLVKVLIPSLDLEQKQNLGFNDPTSAIQLGAVFVTLVVLPPLVEELVFRGFIYGGLRSRFNVVSATIVTSVLFAVGHLQFGNSAPLLWVAAIDTFVLSVVMCYVRERTGSIIPTIFMHALKNLIAFYFLYIFKLDLKF